MPEEALRKSEASLREQSLRDHLTGLFNRRYMEETFKRKLVRPRENSSAWVSSCWTSMISSISTIPTAMPPVMPSCVELGNCCSGHVRGEDIACRYGGDEFIIVLPDTGQDVTYERAELICEYTKQLQLQYEGQTLETVSFCVGVAVFPQDGTTSTAILRAVDAALYRAKHAGNGQVVAAD